VDIFFNLMELMKEEFNPKMAKAFDVG